MVRYSIDVPSRLQKLHMTVDFLIWVVLQLHFNHFLSIHDKWFLEAEHPAKNLLPIVLIVFSLGLTDEEFL